ncbi:TetR family transcriptional regulator [Novosphingobium sp. FGD1]|uniref:TetR family transcriptional regulator n=1 Tax=Novosphingobium silvae TaxID=2692619 RepID=A0A7X4K8U3_9SPHN|nr:helix-turn-helix domain-containing protein [Novosphingobium silvae]MYL98678.1 TetR family transcriptional regulator [Novosphingobium silvae]
METSLNGLRREAPTDARQVRSRHALTSALLALLEEKPFDQLTIREITARAGTGYATFFRHYPTKEALLADVASAEIADLLERTIPILYEANSYESTLALCVHVSEHAMLWSALLTGGAAALVRDEFIRQARGLIDGAVSRNSWLPSDLGVVHGTGSTFDILAWWLAQDGEAPAPTHSPEEVATILHRLVIAPLVGDTLERRPVQA